MTDHPSTFRGPEAHAPGVEWDDRAVLQLAENESGLLDGAKGLRSGTLAEMVSQVMAYPPETRGRYVIEKLGDRRLDQAEIEALAAREDFPQT